MPIELDWVKSPTKEDRKILRRMLLQDALRLLGYSALGAGLGGAAGAVAGWATGEHDAIKRRTILGAALGSVPGLYTAIIKSWLARRKNPEWQRARIRQYHDYVGAAPVSKQIRETVGLTDIEPLVQRLSAATGLSLGAAAALLAARLASKAVERGYSPLPRALHGANK